MVRLKVYIYKVRFRHASISIPYGAIKRCKSPVSFIILSSFQFLMVRLKDSPFAVYTLLEAKFQFLMVRLKDITMTKLLKRESQGL